MSYILEKKIDLGGWIICEIKDNKNDSDLAASTVSYDDPLDKTRIEVRDNRKVISFAPNKKRKEKGSGGIKFS